MPDDFQPSRQKTDLAEVVEMLLDKGIVINADIAVSIGDTQLLGVQVRAAIASFETAAKYGLEFPEGTDMRRVAEAVGEPELAEMDRPNPVIDPTRGVNVTPDERYVDEERLENEESEVVEESNTGGDGGDGTVTTPDRGTERLGACPDPERPTSGGFDLISDDEGEVDGAGEATAGSDEAEQHDEQPATQTEEN
ncbi:gas vesicle protein GvpJ [Natronobacterium gregoryi]|uniref:Gas vesicle protein n=1 Tax=Natronobacterium gregoryi (strain ATCC 43098 / DSM 3393 / CCM 3738 / CIP 104747 / IAM 13177 / JCM 8860 / NBRC 102187 / NCIMB 2189 / SP2) TaxID=797304 RepID=A0A2J4JJJ9_NATGS|nr:gas vesicle protein [Natronobacterium gregoryi]PLK22093.1 gas vesicle protein [Natronobacterium gregoryi SP2]